MLSHTLDDIRRVQPNFSFTFGFCLHHTTPLHPSVLPTFHIHSPSRTVPFNTLLYGFLYLPFLKYSTTSLHYTFVICIKLSALGWGEASSLPIVTMSSPLEGHWQLRKLASPWCVLIVQTMLRWGWIPLLGGVAVVAKLFLVPNVLQCLWQLFTSDKLHWFWYCHCAKNFL